MAKKSKMLLIPLLGMVLFWNGIVGVFNGIIVTQLYREFDARTRFEEVPARITRSKVDHQSSSDGSTYRPEIQFTYEFNGATYTSDRFAYAAFGTSDKSHARDTCARFPAGSETIAHVDPADPAEAVLDVSGDAFPAAILVFLTPFNCIGLFLIGLLISTIRRRDGEEDEGVRARYLRVNTGDHVVVGKPPVRPVHIFLGSLTATSFVGTFLVIAFFGFYASLTVVLGALTACLGLSGTITLRSIKKSRSPARFLHIDRVRGTYSYPADAPGEPLSTIQSIVVDPEPTGVTINDEVQYRHRFEAKTPSGLVTLFDVKSGLDEGNEVMELLLSELTESRPDSGGGS